MSEMIIVITRVIAEQNDDEWINWHWPKGLFAKETHAVTIDNSYNGKSYNLSQNDAVKNFIDNTNSFKIVVLRGKAKEIIAKLNDSFNGISPLIAIHAGVNKEEEAKIVLKEKLSNLSAAIDKAQFYSIGGSRTLTPAIEHLAKALTVKKNIEDAYQNLLKELKKKSNPYLIALSILCKGYLAAHGDDDSIKELSEELKKEVQDLIKGLPDELRKKVQTKDNKNKTKGKTWWTDVLGKDKKNDKQKILDELNAISTNKVKEKETLSNDNGLIDEIYKDGDNLPNGELVAEAYSALKSILQGES